MGSYYDLNYFPQAPQAGVANYNNNVAGGRNNNMGFGGSGFGFNLNTFDSILGGLQTGFGIYNALAAQKQAKKEFAFGKEIANANLNNSIQSYNTSLEDRIRSRVAMEGRPSSDADAYLDQHKLSR